jgi:hypothetical protein
MLRRVSSLTVSMEWSNWCVRGKYEEAEVPQKLTLTLGAKSLAKDGRRSHDRLDLCRRGEVSTDRASPSLRADRGQDERSSDGTESMYSKGYLEC